MQEHPIVRDLSEKFKNKVQEAISDYIGLIKMTDAPHEEAVQVMIFSLVAITAECFVAANASSEIAGKMLERGVAMIRLLRKLSPEKVDELRNLSPSELRKRIESSSV